MYKTHANRKQKHQTRLDVVLSCAEIMQIESRNIKFT